ncbi:MAG: ATP-dependent zinc metalloprotease FtsH [Candidatus Glassbacteria bacterium]
MVEKDEGKKKSSPRRPARRPPRKKPPIPSGPKKVSTVSKTLAFWILILLLPLTIYNFLSMRESEFAEISYSDFRREMTSGNVESVTIVEKEITGELKEQSSITIKGKLREYRNFKTYLPFEDPSLVKELEEHGVSPISSHPPKVKWWLQLLSWLPWIFLLGLWIFFLRQVQGGGSKAFSFGKSKARLLTGDTPKVTFEDVAGCNEAKEELEEIIEFLKDPRRFQRLGGRIPKGALLLGSPGTGKTLLAKAVAGEAGVPFFSMSGSDFVEMFVGVGASRVRDLFEQGKAHAPCIIFIDEIDAVGRHRGAGLGGGHDEREQTLNQLLVEMDGFESKEGVILLAATNRPDVLDPALLRPGRFDRQIVVDSPDVRGREGILKVHTRNIPLNDDVNLEVLAKATPGLSGADLANIVNEAALLAARRNKDKVDMEDFESAKDKVMMGAERKSLVISEEEKKAIAYHESGHALVRVLTPGADPVHKVTIIPRGQALGVTHFLPLDDRRIYSKTWCENNLTALLGGRAAEELVLGDPTTGAGNDLDRATELARRMVSNWGMSDKLGHITFGKKEETIFLGREISQPRDYSEETAKLIDSEVKGIVEDAYITALNLLKENIDKLHAMASALLEREILDGEEIAKIIKGEELAKQPVDEEKSVQAEVRTGMGENPEPSQTPKEEDRRSEGED